MGAIDFVRQAGASHVILALVPRVHQMKLVPHAVEDAEGDRETDA
jgi:hypothetical protein